jgi:hypothetical protein
VADDWQNEDDIKAELRTLTAQVRKLRDELRNMVAPPKPQNPSRAFLHRQSWSSRPPTADDRQPPSAKPPRPKKNR